MLLRKYISHEQTENGWLIHGDTADVMLVFMTDDVVRIRVSFNRDFREESYTLVTTAWADRLDPLFEGERQRITALSIPCDEDETSLRFTTNTMQLILK